jgi:hypothetical protein
VTMRQALAARRSKCKHGQNLKRKYQKFQNARSIFIRKNCRGNSGRTCNICKKRKCKKNAQSAVCKQCKQTRKTCNICQRKKTTVRRINARVNRYHRHCKVLKGRYMLKTHHSKYVRSSGRSVTAKGRNKGSMIQVMNNRDGTVSLKTSKGKYFTAERNGALNARARGKRNQKFLVIFNKRGTVSFMSAYNKYVVAERNGKMNANRARNGPWEKFRVVRPRRRRRRVLLQVPNAEVPAVELPNAELPNAELPNVELLNAKPPNAEGKL